MHVFIMYQKRIQVWKDTIKISDNVIDPPISIKYKYDRTIILPKVHDTSTIDFHNNDAINSSFLYPSSLILNLADDLCPGGSVDVGSGAQEESIFRRTNYHKTLLDTFYPIIHGEAIYSPNVTLLKNDQWELMEHVRHIHLVACPALKYPRIVLDNQKNPRLSKRDIDRLKEKIITIIQIAVHYKYDTIVFGAMGCGEWCNPIVHVAEIFQEVLEMHKGCVLHYVFAILSTNDIQPKTIDIFKHVFSSPI